MGRTEADKGGRLWGEAAEERGGVVLCFICCKGGRINLGRDVSQEDKERRERNRSRASMTFFAHHGEHENERGSARRHSFKHKNDMG